MLHSTYLLDYADLVWQDTDTPMSPDYGDIYWSRAGASAEKQHVFIEGNQLPLRWSRLTPLEDFTLLETGFGFGLNFLLSAAAWQQHAPAQAQLHYLAIEQSPVNPADLKHLFNKLFSNETDAHHNLNLASLADALLTAYPLPMPGTHVLWLTQNISLTLIFADVLVAVQSLQRPLDAIFLDGFSPAKNQAMWAEPVFMALARHCHNDTSVSSYSVAGSVRDGLGKAGFTVSKQPGFGSKAQMLTARFTGSAATGPLTTPAYTRQKKTPRHVAIIGAGLAGLHCAAALLRRGSRVTVIDKAQAPLQGASGIPQLAIYPQLAARPDIRARFSLAAFDYLRRQGQYHASGFILTADSARQRERLNRINAQVCDQLARLIESPMTPGEPALYFPAGGWLSAAEQFADTLEQVTLNLNCTVNSLVWNTDHWQLLGADGEFLVTASDVIIASGPGNFAQTLPLDLGTHRGQAIQQRADNARTTAVLSGPVSIFPPNHEGLRTISGTHSRDNPSGEVSDEDTQALLKRLDTVMPTTQPAIASSAHAALRATSRDRLPVVGPVPDWQALATWCQQRSRDQHAFAAYQPGLFVCTAFGAHGGTHAPLCAEHLARLLFNQPPALDPALQPFLAAERFMQRDIY